MHQQDFDLSKSKEVARPMNVLTSLRLESFSNTRGEIRWITWIN